MLRGKAVEALRSVFIRASPSRLIHGTRESHIFCLSSFCIICLSFAPFSLSLAFSFISVCILHWWSWLLYLHPLGCFHFSWSAYMPTYWHPVSVCLQPRFYLASYLRSFSLFLCSLHLSACLFDPRFFPVCSLPKRELGLAVVQGT